MLSQCLCQVYKSLVLRSLRLTSTDVAVLARRIHSSAKKLLDCELKEQTIQKCETEELPQSMENNDCGRLHIPVMLEEVVNCLSPKPGQQHFLDMTFGAGGHTTALLEKASNITIYALDRDPTAYNIAQQLSELYPYPDMPTAADVVNALDQQALASILRTYGEERHAKKIASAIVQARSIYPITRTQQLASIVAGAFPASALYARKDLLQRPTHIATKTFQALRIFVNNELHELLMGLKTAEKFLKPGGRLVAISFHSLEDRIIKRFFHGIDMTEKYSLGAKQKIRQALRSCSKEEDTEEISPGNSNSKWISIQRKVLTPQAKDIQTNPRGRSAKLRAAVKL
ncbi:12S rRNA N4-methylcytidine (m4C) methyltransferase isoform X3 [Pezoporus wallicus]|uniref:12S rRNA N4-methylcytidine (m4C) methyltransferase isoform X3 n=1 Tax=Pezoporus wallicus TaxID=35540 RepID=UPI00254BB07A|nr:12S rRNA N4-methylcytidine (m4C) methyltransferase isoform X3 [Pezoporus wallicus]XP_061335187.1 12S rRNA N4-methylcytidine (m4C) methyltransferase isoform X3 [Pezoporus flaviventris]